MINPDTIKYALPDRPVSADNSGFYFPDAIVESFANQARDIIPTLNNAEKTLPSGPHPVFTPEQSRTLVLAAFHEFDPGLGKKAEEIFAAGFDQAVADSRTPGFKIDWDKDAQPIPGGSRWRMEQVAAGQARIMSSTPAKQPQSWMGPANPNDYSIISYQFDGTIDALIHIAHETGHSAADDYQREYKDPGDTPASNPEHMNEMQAYMPQHILYDYIERHPELEQTYPGIGIAARRHFAETMAQNIRNIPLSSDVSDENLERVHCRPMGILTALGLFHCAQSADENGRRAITETLLGRNGPKTISETLAVAGIKNRADLDRFTYATMRKATDPAVTAKRDNAISAYLSSTKPQPAIDHQADNPALNI